MATERFDIVVRARGTNQVNRKIKSIGTSANSTRKILALMRSALVIIASIQIIAGFTRLIDVFTEMRNGLRLLSDDTKVLSTIQSALFKISQETRASFETLGDVFFKTARSTLRMGLSFKELLDITKVLAQTVAISGVAVNTANGALIQFSQGLSAGAIQGEELRAVVEGLPELARIIGKEFGIAGGELIAFNKANAGVFVTERVIKSLVAAIPILDEVFGKTQVTISQGFTRVNNALIFFLGGVNDATGASKFLADGLTTIANNIDKVVLGLLVLAGIVVFNFLIGQVLGLIGVMGRLVTLVGVTLVGAFRLLIGTVIVLTNLLKVLRLVVITNPLFIIGALAIGAVVAGFILFEDQIKSTITELGGLRNIFNNVVAFFGSGIIVLIQNWELLGTVITDSISLALNSVITSFENFVNDFGSGITGLRNELTKFVNDFLDPEATTFELVTFEPFKLGRFDVDNTEADASLSSLVKLFEDKFNEIKDSDPAGAIEDNFNALLDFLNQFTKDGTVVLDELLKLFPKGAGEATKLAAGFKNALSAVSSLVGTLGPLESSLLKLKKANDVLAAARKAGIDVAKEFGLTEEEIIKRVTRLELGLEAAGDATLVLAGQTQIYEAALKSGAISQAEFNKLLSDSRIKALELDESFSGQLTLSLLEFQKELSNTGKLASEVIVNAFGAAGDAITEFVTTGKLDFSSLIDSLIADITKLAVKAAILAPLVNLLGFGAPGGDILGSLFGLFGGGGGGGGSPTGAVGGGGGGIGIPGLRTGGQFTVGGSGGADSQLVAFKATPGEEVTVTRPDQRPAGRERAERPIQINFNISTPNADSFIRAEGDIISRAQTQLRRSDIRNN